MAGRLLKKGADGTKRLAGTLAPPTPPKGNSQKSESKTKAKNRRPVMGGGFI